MRRCGPLVVLLAALALPAAAPADGRYVAVGDSIAGASGSYVERHAASLGITDIRKITSGATSGEALTSVIPQAVAAIDDPTDTRVMNLAVGGHDHLRGLCSHGWNRPDCAFADNLFAILGRLRAALDADPGDEPLLVLGYYNPASGLGTPLESSFDAGILGRDLRLDETAHGDDWGSADVVRWVSCRSGATFVDAYPAFKAGGQALMMDQLHPNAAGQAVLAGLFADPSSGSPTLPCPPTTPFATTLQDAGDGAAHGIVEPRLAVARWWFEYGPTTAYGRSTPVAELPASAGTRAVSAALPAARAPNHVRLVTENAVGRFAGEDAVVTPVVPHLGAWLTPHQSRRTILARGVTVRVHSIAASLEAQGRLRAHGPDPVVLRARRSVSPGAYVTLHLPLSSSGRRLVRRAAHPVLVLTLVARGPAGVSEPVRLVLR